MYSRKDGGLFDYKFEDLMNPDDEVVRGQI